MTWRTGTVAGSLAALLLVSGCTLDSDDDNLRITGRVCDTTGRPVERVRICFILDPPECAWTGCNYTATDGAAFTNECGFYEIVCDPPLWGIVLIPKKDGCIFSPNSRSCGGPDRYFVGQDFITHCGEPLQISGFVRDQDGNPMRGVQVYSSPHQAYRLTDAEGYYVLDRLLPNQDYTVHASRTGCTFEPPERTYVGLDRSYHDQGFVATCLRFYALEGHVRDVDGDPLPQVDMVCTSVDECADTSWFHGVTDDTGHYRFDQLPAGDDCIVRPEKFGCSFEPEEYVHIENYWDRLDQDFTAYCD